MLTWRQLIRAMFRPFSIKSTEVSCIVTMLFGTIDALSGGLHMYFLMTELTGGTSKFMWCACLWINIFSQVISSFFLLTDFNILAVLLIWCPDFQNCDAMTDWSVWFNLRFLKFYFFLISRFLFVYPMYTFSNSLMKIMRLYISTVNSHP